MDLHTNVSFRLRFFCTLSDNLKEQALKSGELPPWYHSVIYPVAELGEDDRNMLHLASEFDLVTVSCTPHGNTVAQAWVEPTDNVPVIIESYDDTEEVLLARFLNTLRMKVEARQAFEVEKAAWISLHGSELIQKAYNRGYGVGILYALERGEKEWAGFSLVERRWDELQKVDSPSAEALEVEEKIMKSIQLLDKTATVKIVALGSPQNEFIALHDPSLSLRHCFVYPVKKTVPGTGQPTPEVTFH